MHLTFLRTGLELTQYLLLCTHNTSEARSWKDWLVPFCFTMWGCDSPLMAHWKMSLSSHYLWGDIGNLKYSRFLLFTDSVFANLPMLKFIYNPKSIFTAPLCSFVDMAEPRKMCIAQHTLCQLGRARRCAELSFPLSYYKQVSCSRSVYCHI